MFKKASIAAAAFASFAVASPASAALTLTQSPDPCTSSDVVCVYAFNSLVGAGAFSESAAFTLPQLGGFAGALINIALAGNGDIEFTRVYISNGGTDYDFTITNGVLSQAEIQTQLGGGNYTLNVEGTASTIAGYGGNLTFTAVPEPGTWALFILGFGALGFAMRRRNAKVTATKANLHFA